MGTHHPGVHRGQTGLWSAVDKTGSNSRSGGIIHVIIWLDVSDKCPNKEIQAEVVVLDREIINILKNKRLSQTKSFETAFF